MNSESYWLAAWKKYADFSGRATRSEFWLFQLEIFFIFFLGMLVISILPQDQSTSSGTPIVMVGLIFLLAIIIPEYSVSVRRLHDSGKSGWLVLVCFIPYIGRTIYLILMLLGSSVGDNEYGEDPRNLEYYYFKPLQNSHQNDIPQVMNNIKNEDDSFYRFG